MSAVWKATGPFLLLVLVAANCGSGDAGAHVFSPGITEQTVGEPAVEPVEAVEDHSVPAASDPSPVPSSTLSPADRDFSTGSSYRASTAGRDPGDVPNHNAIPSEKPRDSSALLRASQESPFHQFGDGVYTWDDRRRLVVLAVPADHPSLDASRDARGHWDGTIEDTPGARAWVQQCARQQSDDAIDSPDTVFGAVSAQAIHACLGGLAHLSELFARYWWTEAGVTCLSDAVTAHSLHGDDRPRPLAVCPSIGYNPAAPRPPGWLAQRCAEIVAAHPSAEFSTDPAQPNEALPSCWPPLLSIIETHASENAGLGLPDGAHNCYHAFFGYVWARQTGRESRPPSDLAIGCHYRAFEASP